MKTSKRVIEEAAVVSELISKRLMSHDNNRIRVQEELATRIERLRRELDDLEERINANLQVAYTAEEERLQSALSKINALLSKSEVSNVEKELSSAATEGRTALLVDRTYTLEELGQPGQLGGLLELKVAESVDEKAVLFEERQPSGLKVARSSGFITVDFYFFSEEEQRLMKARNVEDKISYEVSMREEGDDDNNEVKVLLGHDKRQFFGEGLKAECKYEARVRGVYGEKASKWSDSTPFLPSFTECCTWKKCPRYVSSGSEYLVDPSNARIATKHDTGDDDDDYAYGYAFPTYSTAIGNIALPLNRVTSWSIKVRKTWGNKCQGLFVGVAPSDINQDFNENYVKCGWYFSCYYSSLWSGPPHNYRDKKYGPRKMNGQYVQENDSVGIVVDTTKGELSFLLDGVSHDTAFEGIPLDKPLTPCVIMETNGDSIEFIPSI